MAKTKKIRLYSQLQSAFYKWLAENRERFAIQILSNKTASGVLIVHFTGVNRVISAELSNNNFSVHVFVKKFDFWDMLISVDAYPTFAQEGYSARR